MRSRLGNIAIIVGNLKDTLHDTRGEFDNAFEHDEKSCIHAI